MCSASTVELCDYKNLSNIFPSNPSYAGSDNKTSSTLPRKNLSYADISSNLNCAIKNLNHHIHNHNESQQFSSYGSMSMNRNCASCVQCQSHHGSTQSLYPGFFGCGVSETCNGEAINQSVFSPSLSTNAYLCSICHFAMNHNCNHHNYHCNHKQNVTSSTCVSHCFNCSTSLFNNNNNIHRSLNNLSENLENHQRHLRKFQVNDDESSENEKILVNGDYKGENKQKLRKYSATSDNILNFYHGVSTNIRRTQSSLSMYPPKLIMNPNNIDGEIINYQETPSRSSSPSNRHHINGKSSKQSKNNNNSDIGISSDSSLSSSTTELKNSKYFVKNHNITKNQCRKISGSSSTSSSTPVDILVQQEKKIAFGQTRPIITSQKLKNFQIKVDDQEEIMNDIGQWSCRYVFVYEKKPCWLLQFFFYF